MLITVSGVDCSGKSTQIALLRDHLARQGHQAVVVWFRPGYSHELDAVRRLIRRARPGALPKASAAEAREALFRRASVRRSWVLMALLDMMAHYGAKVRALLAAGKTVICDRYTWDGVLDLELRFADLDVRGWFSTRLATYVAPRPDASFLLLLPHEEMVRRMVAKAEPFPDAPAVRDLRFDRYEQLAAGRPELLRIDAAPHPENVHRQILDALERLRS